MLDTVSFISFLEAPPPTQNDGVYNSSIVPAGLNELLSLFIYDVSVSVRKIQTYEREREKNEKNKSNRSF